MNDQLPAPADGRRLTVRRLLGAPATGCAVRLSSARPAEPLFGSIGHRWQRQQPYAAAAFLAAALTALNVRTMAHMYGVDLAMALVLAVAQNAPLLPAVTRPLPAWLAMTAADVAAAPVLLHAPGLPGSSWPWPPAVLVGQLTMLAALTRRARPATLIAVWAVLTASGYALAAASPHNSDGTDTFLTVFGGVVLLVGWMARERASTQRRLVQQQLAGQAERAQLTLLEERARIARELHDVVAHHMSVITVQADSAPYRIGGLPAEAGQEFGAIAATAREALVEMRRLLGVLRSQDGADPELAPQPGLDRLPEVADAAVRAGVPVDLHVDGAAKEPGRLAPAVELVAFRIVQEGLANVVRHAPGARARVDVTLAGGHLGVVVAHGVPPVPGLPLEHAGTGHGLVGMGERVRLVGGSLATAPLPDGGFQVTARIPLHEVPRCDVPLHDKDGVR